MPLRTDETGTIRIGPSRVTLDVVLADYRNGSTPEEIVRQLDTLTLADVYEAIEYYNCHREEVEQYLTRLRMAEAESLRKEIEAKQPDRTELRARLILRAQESGGHATAGR